MSSSKNVLKSSFIQFTGENTRVIDSSALVAKRIEGFTGVLRERDDDCAIGEDFCAQGIDELTSNSDCGQDDMSEPVAAKPTPEELLEQANSTVEQMLEDAKQQAKEIIAQANATAEKIKEAARQEGYDAGKKDALDELTKARAELDKEHGDLIKQYEETLMKLEPQMVEVITKVYEKVFGENFFSRRDVMVCLINKALMHVENKEQVTIYVCHNDYDMLMCVKESLFDKISLENEPQFIQRDDFVNGQAKIETQYGIIDCSIDAELKELTRVLTLLSYEGNAVHDV